MSIEMRVRSRLGARAKINSVNVMPHTGCEWLDFTRLTRPLLQARLVQFHLRNIQGGALDSSRIHQSFRRGSLLSWNFRHIASAAARSRFERACRRAGYEPPII